jgi:CRP-like cAMP-binding protein
MMALLDGTIRISVPSADGKELFLTIIRPGEVLTFSHSSNETLPLG